MTASSSEMRDLHDFHDYFCILPRHYNLQMSGNRLVVSITGYSASMFTELAYATSCFLIVENVTFTMHEMQKIK